MANAVEEGIVLMELATSGPSRLQTRGGHSLTLTVIPYCHAYAEPNLNPYPLIPNPNPNPRPASAQACARTLTLNLTLTLTLTQTPDLRLHKLADVCIP